MVELIWEYLEGNGLKVDIEVNGVLVVVCIFVECLDLVVFDLMLLGEDGLFICC